MNVSVPDAVLPRGTRPTNDGPSAGGVPGPGRPGDASSTASTRLRVLVAVLLCAAFLALAAWPTSSAEAALPAAAPKTSTGLKIGAAAQDQAAFDSFDAQAGTFKARRTYNSKLPSSFMKSLARTDVAAGRTSYWSFRPNPKTFYKDKSAQRAFSKFLDTIPAGHPTVVVALHEPEDEIAAHTFTLKQWAKTNDSVGKIVHSKHRPELRHGICLMGPWTFDSRSPYYGYRWDKALNMKYVDVVGIDPYKFRTTDPSLERMLTKSDSGNGTTSNPSVMKKLSSWGKPIALMEFGVSATDRYTGATIPDSVRAGWITDAVAWMNTWNASNTVKIEAANYFQLHPGGPFLTGEAVTALDATTT